MSRLNYAPQSSEIKITDIKKGLGVFTPKPAQAVSFAALKAALKKAGYALDSAEITIAGKLIRDGQEWVIVADISGQRFTLTGANVDKVLAGARHDTQIEMTGDWKTVGTNAAAREVVSPRELKKVEKAPKAAAIVETNFSKPSTVKFMTAGYNASADGSPSDSFGHVGMPVATAPPAPIRVTSPGLTVYKGGAVTPRLYFIEQHLGGLRVSRQLLDVSVSYTPSPRLQLEAEVPISRTAFDDGVSSGSGAGLGNVTLWGKYRFFRTVKTYGDRQAAARFGLELPTGKKSAPTEREIDAPAFVRQQLTPISGGLSPHFDLAFSQAGGRLIFGGNVEAVLRSERDGFRMGHEVRVNTDLEYVLLPFKYDTPGGELFIILETTFVHRGPGHLDSAVVAGSNSTEYYLAPGLQYAAAPRFVIEGSIQLPVVRNTGPLVLRNDRNILLGVRYLF
ncbi:MAG: hypothetical protein H0T60_14720 [Acidobacteria bacterium]|nr:hypothetical protein [Acidobacteriota bacterium]